MSDIQLAASVVFLAFAAGFLVRCGWQTAGYFLNHFLPDNSLSIENHFHGITPDEAPNEDAE